MSVDERAGAIFLERQRAVWCATDRMFVGLLLAQWMFAIVMAATVSPYTWAGTSAQLHPHVMLAVWFGAAINALPIALIALRPGEAVTRHAVAIAQMLWSAVLIHLTGGRIETHFHVFGSLAFLAFYRDWRVLVTATIVTASDHFIRGMWFPQSVYGLAEPATWRFLEHSAWVLFEDVVLVLGCQRGVAELRAIAAREASLHELNAGFERRVHEKTQELTQNMARYRTLVEGTSAVPWEVDGDTLRFTYVSPQIVKVFGHRADQMLDNDEAWLAIHKDDRQFVKSTLTRLLATGGETNFEFRVFHADGRLIHARASATAPIDADGIARRVSGITLDVTEQKQLETELRQAQKLESVGRLAAGVAHEINTPVQFVSDNVRFLRDATTEMFTLVERLRLVNDDVLGGRDATANAAQAAAVIDAADVPYLQENVPSALESSIDGLHRVAEIIRSMKEFARAGRDDRDDLLPVDLNHAIRSTLTITKNEYRYVAEVETDFGDLPPVECNLGGINQVVVNIVVNAAHAIADVLDDSGTLGRIVIRTRVVGDSAVISISDTGGGIPDDARDHVFEPFFTTKEVGKGTGQGLAIARTIIERHHGSLRFESTIGVGTTFYITLPLTPTPAVAPAAAAAAAPAQAA